MQYRIGGVVCVVIWGLAALFAWGESGITPDGLALAAVLMGRDATEAERQTPQAPGALSKRTTRCWSLAVATR